MSYTITETDIDDMKRWVQSKLANEGKSGDVYLERVLYEAYNNGFKMGVYRANVAEKSEHRL